MLQSHLSKLLSLSENDMFHFSSKIINANARVLHILTNSLHVNFPTLELTKL